MLSQLWDDVGVQAQLRLLDAYHTWRIGMKQDGQKAEVAQGAVRQAYGGDIGFAFHDIGVEITSVDCDTKIIDVRVKPFECFYELLLYFEVL